MHWVSECDVGRTAIVIGSSVPVQCDRLAFCAEKFRDLNSIIGLVLLGIKLLSRVFLWLDFKMKMMELWNC